MEIFLSFIFINIISLFSLYINLILLRGDFMYKNFEIVYHALENGQYPHIVIIDERVNGMFLVKARQLPTLFSKDLMQELEEFKPYLDIRNGLKPNSHNGYYYDVNCDEFNLEILKNKILKTIFENYKTLDHLWFQKNGKFSYSQKGISGLSSISLVFTEKQAKNIKKNFKKTGFFEYPDFQFIKDLKNQSQTNIYKKLELILSYINN